MFIAEMLLVDAFRKEHTTGDESWGIF